ncbi:hypothetical protein V6N13_026553 [Hibiscus sabdariffa]
MQKRIEGKEDYNKASKARCSGVKDGSSSSSALLAASSQLSSKRWFARAIVRISSTMSTESSTCNHFFDILEKIKQFRSMPIADHVVSFPVESEGAVDGRGITGLFGSMVGKLSSLERIDQQAALHAVTIEEIRVEISESSPLHPYISSLSLAKKENSHSIRGTKLAWKSLPMVGRPTTTGGTSTATYTAVGSRKVRSPSLLPNR